MLAKQRRSLTVVWLVPESTVYLVDLLLHAWFDPSDMKYMEQMLSTVWPDTPWSLFKHVKSNSSYQTDAVSCGLFASFYARESAQGRAIGGPSPIATEIRALMRSTLESLVPEKKIDKNGDVSVGDGEQPLLIQQVQKITKTVPDKKINKSGDVSVSDGEGEQPLLNQQVQNRTKTVPDKKINKNGEVSVGDGEGEQPLLDQQVQKITKTELYTVPYYVLVRSSTVEAGPGTTADAYNQIFSRLCEQKEFKKITRGRDPKSSNDLLVSPSNTIYWKRNTKFLVPWANIHIRTGESLHGKDTFGFLNYLKENRRIVGILPDEVAVIDSQWMALEISEERIALWSATEKAKTIQEAKYFFLPFHTTDNHCFAIVYNSKSKQFLICDSNKRESESEYHAEVGNFSRFLDRVLRLKVPVDVRGHIYLWSQFWQQDNGHDCGALVSLAFMYLFCNNFATNKPLCTLLPDDIPKVSPSLVPAQLNLEKSILEIRRTIFILACMPYEFAYDNEDMAI